jgi:Spy/CpxP family protein refolding chaperone
MVGMMISTTIFAQNVTRDSRKPEGNGYERMKRELALSDKQYASVKDINSRYSKKRGEEQARFERRRFEERETMRSLRFEREQEMRKVLTPAQSKKWDELRAIKKNESKKNQGHFRKGKGRYDDRHGKHFRKDGRERRNARPGMERKG